MIQRLQFVVLIFPFFILSFICAVSADLNHHNKISKANKNSPIAEKVKAPEILSAAFDNYALTIDHAEIGYWLKQPNADENTAGTVRQQETDDGRVEMIAVTYQLNNNSSNKKINFRDNFRFHLMDEFDNEYVELDKPLDYTRPVRFAPSRFPSIYPQEVFKETVFFEAPIKESRTLKLLVKRGKNDASPTVEIPVPVDKIMVYDNKRKQLAASQQYPGLRIVIPSSETPVKPGELVHMHVLVHGVKGPDSVVVVALDTTFEDLNPGKNNVYDLNIPENQAPGPLSASVIGRWVGKDGQEDLVLSDSVVINVVAPLAPLNAVP